MDGGGGVMAKPTLAKPVLARAKPVKVVTGDNFGGGGEYGVEKTVTDDNFRLDTFSLFETLVADFCY